MLCCRGGFTLEASIWLPLVLVTIVIGLIAGMIIYQHVALYTLAERVAERTAYSWDNSHKQIESGSVDADKRDGLYWRLTSDGAVPFLSGGVGHAVTYELPGGEHEGESLPLKKLGRGGTLLQGHIYGEISYENRIIEKIITVKLEKPLRLPLWLHRLFGFRLRVEASRAISDPVEYIRGINLIRTYTGMVDREMTPGEVMSLFHEPLSDSLAVNVNSHAEAVRWLRIHTGGVEAEYPTSLGIRVIDSLTSDLTAHQAFYSTRGSQLIIQADKDAELLRQGAVSRVVWHFFLGANNRYPPPTSAELAALKERGIEVEIHPGGKRHA
jgi:hypothetical protein